MGIPPPDAPPAGAGAADCGVYLGACGTTGALPGIGVAWGAPTFVSGMAPSAGAGGGGAMGPVAAGEPPPVEMAYVYVVDL
jgi:hypothetical protein